MLFNIVERSYCKIVYRYIYNYLGLFHSFFQNRNVMNSSPLGH